jgi:hypothetical protein
LVCFFSLHAEAFAAVSCNVSVTPSLLTPGASVGLTFTVSNTTGDGTPIRWIMLTVPQEEAYTVISSNITDWNVSPSSTSLLVSSNELADGGSLSIPVYVQTQADSTDAQPWHIQASDDPSGSNDIMDCGGSLNTQISLAPTATTAPGEPTATPAIITRYISPTLRPSPTPDMRPPGVSFPAQLKKVYQDPPTIAGTASDPSGIDRIEYSTDGKTYRSVDTTRLGSTVVPFRFSPNDLDDGSYPVTIRSVDTKGNTGVVSYGTLIIDRIPPKIGGATVLVGNQVAPIDPETGFLTLPGGLSATIIVNAIGGCTLVSATLTSPLSRGEPTSLSWSYQTGVWSGRLAIPMTPGIYAIHIVAHDGGGGIDERDVGSVVVIKPGTVVDAELRPIPGARVSVYRKIDTGFVLWDGSTWGIENPKRVDSTGIFSFVVPPGSYSIRVSAPGYRTTETTVGSVESLRTVALPILLDRQPGITIGSVFIAFPPYIEKTIPWSMFDHVARSSDSERIGKPIPEFRLPTALGDVTSSIVRGGGIVTVTGLWVPGGSEQLSAAAAVASKDIPVVALIPLASQSEIDVFAKRAGYAFSVVADPTGSLIGPLGITQLPYHMRIDRYGVVRSVRYGQLDAPALRTWYAGIE